MFEPQDNDPLGEPAGAAAWPFLPAWPLCCGAGFACAPPLGFTSNVCAAAGTAKPHAREQNRTRTFFFTGPPERQFRCSEHPQAHFQLLRSYPAANQVVRERGGPAAAQMWYAGTLCTPTSTHPFL